MKNTHKFWFSAFFITLMTVGGVASFASQDQRFFRGLDSVAEAGFTSVLNIEDSSPGKSPLPFPTEKVKEENAQRLEAIEEIPSDEQRIEETVAAEDPTPVEPSIGCTSKETPVIREGELVGCRRNTKINIIQ